MTALIVLLLQLLATVAQPLGAGGGVRTSVADGSVWADVGRVAGGVFTARMTQRLGDFDRRQRWIALDVDGDGRTDLVGIVLDGGQARVELWRASADGFDRTALAALRWSASSRI